MNIMRCSRHAAVAVLLAVIAVAVVRATGVTYGRPPLVASGMPRYGHVFVIMMENHSYGQIIGDSDAPRINSLARGYGLATNYHGVTHPSEPNYVASISGSYFRIQDDAPYNSAANGVNHTINGSSVASQLEAAGLDWKAYQQSLPYPGYAGSAFPDARNALYASKHNPFVNFAGIQHNRAEMRKIVPDTQLFTDLRSGKVPGLSYIVPDQCHDMHGTPSCSDATALMRQGDTYAGRIVEAIMRSPVWTRGYNAIVITWDEDESIALLPSGCCDANPGGGHVPTIVIANRGPRGVHDNTPYNHYSLLRTIQEAFHLPCLRYTCDTRRVVAMRRLFAVGRGIQRGKA